ncbi:MAG: NAD(P)H-hydrate dehydratase [Bacteroidales bacterium]|nr:NAD(P)H-hydrate dehydratase [Bacteroidales bacterium]
MHTDFINNVKVQDYFIEKNNIKSIIKIRKKFSHKGNFGHALLISGSYGKMGAAVLASKACLRTGVGLLTTHIPKLGYNILQTAIPEAMTNIDTSDKFLSELSDLLKYNSIGIGPGIGTEEQTQKTLKLLIQNSPVPLVIDADAINILGENKTWISFLPENSILTPHPKEFKRIAGKTYNDFERNKIQREFSIKNKVYLVLKGAHTAISCPDGNCYFNSTGNPGMATAGSGDVLTGIILSLYAQGYSSKNACILGVYIHGLAGDISAEKLSFGSLIASEIINNLNDALKKIIMF